MLNYENDKVININQGTDESAITIEVMVRLGKTDKFRDSRGDYRPTPEEMGLSESDVETMKPERYEALIKQFNSRRMEKEKAIAKVKSEKDQIAAQNHWYNSLDKDHIERLVAKTIGYYAEISQDLIRKTGSQKLEKYYNESLRDRVKLGNMILRPTSYERLKRFPKYNERQDALTGTPQQFMHLYSTAFPPYFSSKSITTL